jgi:hypothetical protein
VEQRAVGGLVSSRETPEGWIILFDTDDYVYVLASADQAAAWLEPATVAELDAAYDGQGNSLDMVLEGKTYRLRCAAGLGPATSLSDRVRRAHGRGNLLQIDLSAEENEVITSQLQGNSASR